jgi:hypothetical protein
VLNFRFKLDNNKTAKLSLPTFLHYQYKYSYQKLVNLLIPATTLCTTRLNIQKFYLFPTYYVYVFAYTSEQTVICPVQHETTRVYVENGGRFLRSKTWVFK